MAVENQVDKIFAGNKRVLRFTVLDEDTVGSPPFNLTGLIVKFALAPFDANGNPLVDSPVIDKRSGVSPDVVITVPASGIVEVTLQPADTASLLPADYYFELELYTGSNADPVVLATGTLTVGPNVVNAP